MERHRHVGDAAAIKKCAENDNFHRPYKLSWLCIQELRGILLQPSHSVVMRLIPDSALRLCATHSQLQSN
ncbi:MAG: hypothetical protein WAW69_16700, partial [Polaromonas sp.]